MAQAKGPDRYPARPKGFSVSARSGLTASRGAETGLAGRPFALRRALGARVAWLIAGCVAAAPALVSLAISFDELPGSARAALIVGSLCAAAILFGGGLATLNGPDGVRDRSAARPEAARTLESAMSDGPVADDAPLDPLAFYWSLRRSAALGVTPPDAPVPPEPKLSPPEPAEPAVRASWSHVRRLSEMRRRNRRGALRGASPTPAADAGSGKVGKLVWAIHQMSKGETARRHADEVARGLRPAPSPHRRSA